MLYLSKALHHAHSLGPPWKAGITLKFKVFLLELSLIFYVKGWQVFLDLFCFYAIGLYLAWKKHEELMKGIRGCLSLTLARMARLKPAKQ